MNASMAVDGARREAEQRHFLRRADALAAVVDDAETRIEAYHRRVATEARVTAEASAAHTRQWGLKQERVSRLHDAAKETAASIVTAETDVADLESRLLATREEMIKAQQAYDDREEQVGLLEKEIDAATHHVNLVEQQAKGHAAEWGPERRGLETRVSELQSHIASATSTARQLAQDDLPIAEESWVARRNELRTELERCRRDAEQSAALLRTARLTLDEHAAAEDDGARRWRRRMEQEAHDRAAERKVAQEQLSATISDMDRRQRGATQAAIAELRATASRLETEELPVLRDACATGFQRDVRLRDELAVMSSSCVGREAAKERAKVLQSQLDRLKRSTMALERDCASAEGALKQREAARVASADSASSVAEVEQTCSELLRRYRESHTVLVQMEADYELWRAETDDDGRELQAVVERRAAEVREAEHRRRARALQWEDERDDLSDMLRRLEEKRAVVSQQVAEEKERGHALDAAMKTIDRQRRELLEASQKQRNAAKAAATTLLSQLEGPSAS